RSATSGCGEQLDRRRLPKCAGVQFPCRRFSAILKHRLAANSHGTWRRGLLPDVREPKCSQRSNGAVLQPPELAFLRTCDCGGFTETCSGNFGKVMLCWSQ